MAAQLRPSGSRLTGEEALMRLLAGAHPAGVKPMAVDDVAVMPLMTPREEALELIVAETNCTPTEADIALVMVHGLVDAARSNGGTVHVEDGDLRSRSYEILDMFMGHGERARPGSAHAAVEALYLRPELGEVALMHNVQTTGRRSYCTVSVLIQYD